MKFFKNYIVREALRNARKVPENLIALTLFSATATGLFLGPRSSHSLIENVQNFEAFDLAITSEIAIKKDCETAIEELDFVEEVQGTFEKYTTILVNNQEISINLCGYHPESLINAPILKEGRLPENANECVVTTVFLQENLRKIGDSILVASNDFLVESTLEIVGVVDTPLEFYLEKSGNNTDPPVILLHESGFLGEFDKIYLDLVHDMMSGDDLNQIRAIEQTFWAEEKIAYAEIAEEKYFTAYEELKSLETEQISWIFEEETMLQAENQQIALGWEAYSQEPTAEKKDEMDQRQQRYTDLMLQFQNKLQQSEEVLLPLRKVVEQTTRELATIDENKWKINTIQEDNGFGNYYSAVSYLEKLSIQFSNIFLFASILAIISLIIPSIDHERTIIGALWALGYRKRDIILRFAILPVTASILGGSIGALVACNLFPRSVYKIWKESYILGEYTLDFPIVSFISLILFMIFLEILVVTCSICVSMKNAPAHLMRRKPPPPGGSIFLEKNYILWNSLKFNQKIAVRNIFRYKKQLFFNVLVIGMVAALLVTAFALQYSFSEGNRRQFDEISQYSTEICMVNQVTPLELDEIHQVCSEFSVDKVESYSETVLVQSNAGQQEVNLLTFESGNDIDKVIYLRQSLWLPYNLPSAGVIIPKKVAENLQINLGDSLTMEGENWSIVGEVSGFSEQYSDFKILMTHGYFQGLMKRSVDKNSIFFDDSLLEEVKLDEFYKKLENLDGVSEISLLMDEKEDNTNSIKTTQYFIFLIIFLACALAFLLMYQQTAVQLSRRRRELATLKVLGFYDNELTGYIYRENTIFLFYGVVLGVVLGMNFYQSIIKTIEIESMQLYRGISLMSYLRAAGLTVAFGVVANLLHFAKMKRLSPVEELKQVE